MSVKATNNITSHTVYSIGHGSRSMETFLAILHDYGIKFLADIRSYPSSKRYPQFNRETLQLSVGKAGISYTWFSDLGGFRKTGLGDESPHVALKSPGARKYADHMATESFRAAGAMLSRLANTGRTCFMCAETLPFKCHRSLLADYFLIQGIETIHILDNHLTKLHQLSALATVSKNRIIYNRAEAVQMELQ